MLTLVTLPLADQVEWGKSDRLLGVDSCPHNSHNKRRSWKATVSLHTELVGGWTGCWSRFPPQAPYAIQQPALQGSSLFNLIHTAIASLRLMRHTSQAAWIG